jgi:hypothetical protein
MPHPSKTYATQLVAEEMTKTKFEIGETEKTLSSLIAAYFGNA